MAMLEAKWDTPQHKAHQKSYQQLYNPVTNLCTYDLFNSQMLHLL